MYPIFKKSGAYKLGALSISCLQCYNEGLLCEGHTGIPADLFAAVKSNRVTAFLK